MSTVVFLETFTAADGTLLTAHAPDVASAGTYFVNADPVAIQTNRFVGTSGTNGHTAYYLFDSTLTLTLPYTVSATIRSQGIGIYQTGVILSGATDGLNITLSDPTTLAVVTNASEEFDAVVSDAEHIISVYIESAQFTVTIDGAAQTPMVHDHAPNGFDSLTYTLEYPGSGTSYVDSVSVVDSSGPTAPATNPDLPSITAPSGAPPFLADGHGIDEDAYYGQVPYTTGHSRARRRWTQTARVVTVRWLLEEDELAEVDDWYENTLLAGTREWSARVRKQGAWPDLTLWWRARWIDYQTEMLEKGRGIVSGRLLLTGEGSADPPDTGALAMEVSIALRDIRSTVSVPAHLAMEISIALLQPTELAIEIEVALLMDYFITGARITEDGVARTTETGDARAIEF
jgi:hypothetical protein